MYFSPSNSLVSLPSALGQGALRIELELELAGEVLLGEQLVLPDIGGDHLPDLARLQQPAEPDAVDAGIIGDDGQVFHPGIADRIRQGFGDAAQAKAPGHDHHAVLENALEGGFGVRIDLVHEIRPDGGAWTGPESAGNQ